MKTSICSGWEFSREWSEDFLNFVSDAEPVELPHNPVQIPLHYADHQSYQMLCGYRRKLVVPASMKNRRLFLQFDGAGHIATVYVNGQEAGRHSCGYTAFRVDITRLVKPGENNIAVRLDTTENATVPPFGNVIDYLTYGGLYREAWFIDKSVSHIRDVTVVTPTLDSLEVTVDAVDFSGDYVVSLFTQEGEKIWESRSRKNKLCAQCLRTRPWRPEEPIRYLCEVKLVDGSREEDVETVKFGFRTTEFRPEGFYLNGERFFLRGLNRHQCFPYIGYAAPESLQREDARILKEELHCTAVRTSHYPQSQYFLDECDRLGLLVFTEIPGWQHIGDEAWKEQVCRNVEEMVTQYRNHPSIILWGVRINESLDDDALYRQTNKLAHKLDPTRATSGVRYLMKSRLLEDVYAYNDFSHTGKNPGCRPKKKVSSNKRRALLITEHNGHMFPTKSYDTWEKRQEHAMRHLRVLNAAYASTEHAGCIGWCMFDYPTHKEFGSGDRVCYHGVLDAFRNPKLAAAAYASQGEGEILLEVGSSMDIGDYPAGQIGEILVFSNADEVALYKNGAFVGKLGRVAENALPHPPFVVDDTIGVLLETQEGFSHKKAQLLHDCLLMAGKCGGMNHLPLGYRMKLAWGAVRYRLRRRECQELFGRYISNWGGAATQWRFEAIVHGKVVKSITRTSSCKLHLEVRPSATALKIGDTFDMAAIRVRILDENENIAPYAQLPVRFAAEGCVSLCGPEIVTAEGGMCGAYIRTAEGPGTAQLTVSADGMEPVAIAFTVEAQDRQLALPQ